MAHPWVWRSSLLLPTDILGKTRTCGRGIMPTLPSPESLVEIVERFGRPRVMLIGDVMVDEYIYGDAERLSPEAPVPVVKERYREQRPGGAGNVAAGLATLGAEVL